jgi:hypothetical protein
MASASDELSRQGLKRPALSQKLMGLSFMKRARGVDQGGGEDNMKLADTKVCWAS